MIGFLITFALTAVMLLCQPAIAADSPLAVLKSDRNAAAYQEQHLGDWEEDWLSFKQTLEAANVRYDLLSDSDLLPGKTGLSGYQVVIVPLLIDLPAQTVFALREYTEHGGKVLVTDGGGMPSQGAQIILGLAGANVVRHDSMTEGESLLWQREPLAIKQEFAVGTLIAEVNVRPGAKAVAKWLNGAGTEAGSAIVRQRNCVYFSWAPGLQGEITTNASLMTSAMEDLAPGVTQQAAVQISFADYQTIVQDLDVLTKQTDEAIKTAKQADLAVPFKTIQQNYDSAVAHVKGFSEAYHKRQFYQADEELKQARRDFATAFAQSMPVRPVEARCVWLDRGTIVAAKSAAGLAQMFDRLKRAGINTVYFETNNAGFAMYPSKLTLQNPDAAGWDPLGTAVREAHKRGMELHAWVWVFAVGNIKHNPIIGRDPDYPGPVLSTHDYTWALASANGSLLPTNQPEFWLDPANPDARRFAKDLVLEVFHNYPVDGIQYDYIRYPFNGKGTEMGYDWVGRLRFEKESGLSLDKLDDATRQVWQAWKIQQVNEFVKDVSTTLKRLKPGFRISAAIYALPLRWRLSAVQQQWETWVLNGWVDTLNPMTYVTTPGELATRAGSVREATDDKSLVYPGLSIRQLDGAGLVEQLDVSREIGTLGTTMFAVAHLDDTKLSMLKLGPYRKQALMTPQENPIRAGRILIDDFAAMVNRYLQDPQKHILSDQASTNDVLSQIMSIERDLHRLKDNATDAEIESVKKQVTSLHSTVKDWLRLEAFIERGFRAQYIVTYLDQLEAILSYAAQRARVQEQIVAVTGNGAQLRESAPTSLREPAPTSLQEPAPTSIRATAANRSLSQRRPQGHTQ